MCGCGQFRDIRIEWKWRIENIALIAYRCHRCHICFRLSLCDGAGHRRVLFRQGGQTVSLLAHYPQALRSTKATPVGKDSQACSDSFLELYTGSHRLSLNGSSWCSATLLYSIFIPVYFSITGFCHSIVLFIKPCELFCSCKHNSGCNMLCLCMCIFMLICKYSTIKFKLNKLDKNQWFDITWQDSYLLPRLREINTVLVEF